MDAFTVHTGTAVPLPQPSIDTDQILPSAYLKRTSRSQGFADGLFHDRRTEEPDFPLDRPQHVGASILVTGKDFGIGSSREHAVWALVDHGFRAVIAPGFGDIFRRNAPHSGLLTVVLPDAVVRALSEAVTANPATPVTVDLVTCEVRWDTTVAAFACGHYDRWRLLEGRDDIDLTLRREDDLFRHEQHRPSWMPRLDR